MPNYSLSTSCYGAQTLNVNPARQAKKLHYTQNQSRIFEDKSFARSLSEVREKNLKIDFTPCAPTATPLREELSQLICTKPLPKRRQRRSP